jgi:hypothetical protein
MIADGALPEKVWIDGNLHVVSANQPTCNVFWGWHVAPTLQVTTFNGVETWVIDPSLFQGPVSQATWKGIQGDPSATLTPTPATTYIRPPFSPLTDPTYTQTNIDLATYRNRLRLRSAGADGPPPYIKCLTKGSGVQWFGLIGGNTVQHWYTWGWSPSTHVIWTVMPLTPCPGAPQLSFSVQVERAGPTSATHWITVSNLTSDPVKFEGRYDVLKW